MSFTSALPPRLASGDRLDRETFHRLYEQLGDAAPKAELIDGVVFLASPTGRPHGRVQTALSMVVGMYLRATPGCDCGSETSIVLGDDTEPRPDVHLRRVRGGTSADGYGPFVVGPPELIVEVAHASHSLDLHGKRRAYQRHGVSEYVVVSLRSRDVHHFDFAGGPAQVLDEGVVRSLTFPGLWIHVAGAVAGDFDALGRCLERGLQSPEHAAFVASLEGPGEG